VDHHSSQIPELEVSPTAQDGRWWDWVAVPFLFLATAVVVIWQTSRLAVLWDLSYILESAYRISLGDIPYRNFVLPFAPLTFLVQAALIKLTGRVYFHHVIYCAVVGGVATVITWRIVLNILRGTRLPARPVAFLLCVPLIALGIYCIFPHPFYDPDCTFAILLCIVLLQELERKGCPPIPAFFAGMLLVVPLFVKQNTGLAFLASVVLALAVLAGLGAWRGRQVRGYALILVGIVAGLTSAILLIHLTVGLGNYAHWTIEFAASRRFPPLRDILSVYDNHLLAWWIAVFAAGIVVSWFNRQANRVAAVFSVALMSIPFAWMSIYLLLDKDSSERAERLLAIWPFLLIVSFVFALLSLRRRVTIATALPFVLIGTVHGAFLSQQVWGSTYALWPLLIILLAGTIETLSGWMKKRPLWEMTALISVCAISLTIAGGFYVWSHERLDYANVSEGEIVRSTLPPLAGLSMRGPWIPQFEELVRYSEREIPREDGLLMIPGEDLFYYTTGRHPQFPVLMFDHTLNPYSPEEIVKIARDRQIRWLIVKRDLQLGGEPVEDKARLMELLRADFQQVESLDNYDVYRRNSSTE
jgi:hypothetical protein